MPSDARAYHRRRLALMAAEHTLTLAVLGLATWALARLRWPPVPEGVSGLAATVALEGAALGALVQLATAPVVVAAAYRLPKRFDLLHQPLPRWLVDRAKATAIRGGLALAGIETIYALLWITPFWWLGAAGVFVAGAVARAVLAPVVLMPLFYRLTPLADGELRERILALAGRAGIPVLGVWVGDQSRKSRTANASVTGLGRTRRIVVWDTLLRGFTPDEVEFVLAHELGHHAHGDLQRMLRLEAALIVVRFWLADRLLRLGAAVFGWSGPADPAGLPWLALVLLGLRLLEAPLRNAFSRRVECQADDFALAIAPNRAAFVATIERLATLNLAERRPGRLEELLLYTHPSVDRRLARQRPAGAPARP